jgi:hypothetical protein
MQPPPGLSLVMRAGVIVLTLRQSKILSLGKSKLTETEKGETSEGQSQGHAHHFL